jgi:hypothetical protein
MRSNAFPKVYRSFEEFERDELRKLDSLTMSIDDMLEDMFSDAERELDFDKPAASSPKPGRARAKVTRLFSDSEED